MLLIYTGNGKGKTSACVGQAIRALGQGLAVAFGQFMKRGDLAGEQTMLAELLGEDFLASGAGFFRDNDFDTHREKAAQLLRWADARVEQGVDMLILDETLYALHHGLLLEEEVRGLVQRCQDRGCHLVLSGRGAPAWMVELADIVSDITEVKHVYAKGGKARRGIEF
ncbi:cob(I)yrinic acid a,c-diamide adenosyltransferase [Desulfomicrobium baculatum]|uniref:corrinoid adenosyltransferase n=1 Tax=Desulfomicrobium baculatum (strain DSM 4028 / VKM B-1378 / X) TaxID=525897 RepID=C7LSF9_DESBD|nr:cob(I)yrinic acid a,c-diamide adenosyltransferase [Desulfomicrobium baculatum]ACU88173.1 ATP:corrinoid adenosyltransferase BtuR/CobO/CobP [Desulfomicrobium baculatum DSM 4028]